MTILVRTQAGETGTRAKTVLRCSTSSAPGHSATPFLFSFLALRPLSCSGQPIPRTSYVGCGIAKDRDAIAGNLGSG